jgi:hypothetical protein
LRRDKIENRQEARWKKKEKRKRVREGEVIGRAAAHDAFPESCASSGFVPFFHTRKPDQSGPWELISTG